MLGSARLAGQRVVVESRADGFACVRFADGETAFVDEDELEEEEGSEGGLHTAATLPKTADVAAVTAEASAAATTAAAPSATPALAAADDQAQRQNRVLPNDELFELRRAVGGKRAEGAHCEQQYPRAEEVAWALLHRCSEQADKRLGRAGAD